MSLGIVKWFDEKRGYGFILEEGTNLEVFAHYSNIKAEGEILLKGQRVEFEILHEARRAKALKITGL